MKKGFTILECILALSVTATIAVMTIPTFMRYTYNYRNDIAQRKNHYYATEALMFIEYELKNSKNTAVTNNIIELQYENIKIKKYISLNNDKYIVITHKEDDRTLTSNRILGKVNDFRVQRKEKTVYITIILNNGEAFERCLKINSIN